MASEFPIIRLSREAASHKRIKGPKPGGFPRKFPFDRQAQRLGEKIDSVAKNIVDLQRGVDVAADPRAVVPERALVLELLGPVRDFESAAQALGFEWLTSMNPMPSDAGPDSDDEDDDAEADDEPADDLEQQGIKVLYLTMPSQQGLQRLLASWRRYAAGKDPGPDERALWALFGYLKELRTWSAQDRVDPAITKYVSALLRARPDRPVRVELDLWYRSDAQRRDETVNTLRRFVAAVGGQVLDLVEISEVRYQGALIEIPAKVALELMEKTGELPNLAEVMTIRPQAAFDPFIHEGEQHVDRELPQPGQLRPCIAVILDGYPITEHRLLQGRLIVLDGEIPPQGVPVSARYHGTAMCSLVVHGDLAKPEPTLDRKLAVIPVLGYSASTGADSPPEGKLAIGVVYRALRRLIQARRDDPELRKVVVVNHAICDTNAPFVRRPSAWAAMLDYFAHAHDLLFVVSGGNIVEPFVCLDFADVTQLAAAAPEEREAALLLALERAKGTRGIFSPAEAVNALTIGALHADAAPDASGGIDPFTRGKMTNVASATGLGTNRSIKPDLVHEGGRFLVQAVDIPGGGVNLHPVAHASVGMLAAAPSHTGDLGNVSRSSGTSNAAALVTRSCNEIADRLDDTFEGDGDDWAALRTRAVILKALVAHGCSWGQLGTRLDKAFPPAEKFRSAARRTAIARFLGFGLLDRARVVSGGEHGATLLADGTIKPDERHEYRLPIPPSVLNTRQARRMVLTLAWSTPVIPTIADYRGVSVEIVDKDGKRKFWDGVNRSGVTQPPGKRSGEQGTLQHLILEGKVLREEFEDSNGLFIGVQARARHPTQQNVPVPYALAITVELSQPQRSSLYVEVRDAIRNRVRTRDRTRIGGR